MSKRTRVLFSSIPGQKTSGQLQTYSQSKDFEQIHSLQEIQNGQHSVCSRITSRRSLHGVSGSTGRISSYSNTSGVSSIHEVCNTSNRRGFNYHHSKKSHVSARSYDILIPGGPMGPNAFKTASTMDFTILEQEAECFGQEGANTTLCQDVTALVVGAISPRGGPTMGLAISKDNNHRCQLLGLGSTYGQYSNSGSLGEGSCPGSFQHQRDGSSEDGTVTIPSIHPGTAYSNQVRQQYSGSPHKSSGRNQEQNIMQQGEQGPSVGRDESGISDGCTPKGNLKCCCRLPQPFTTEPRRMDTKRRGLSESNTQMGDSDNRLICDQEKYKMSQILFPLSHRQSGHSGCICTELEGSSNLCFSTVQVNSKDPQQDLQGESVRHTNNTFLAKKSLVFSVKEVISTGTSNVAPTSGFITSGSNNASATGDAASVGLEDELKLLKKQGFSGNLSNTLLQSRKMVTRKIYLKAWRTYLHWCDENKLDSRQEYTPLEFLQAGLEKGLSISTLKVQTAALSVFLQKRLAENEFFIRFFRAMSRIKPVFKSHVPPWDLNLVLQVLMSPPFEPIQEITEKLLTLKTAFLLAIATARRVGEIQAFSIAEPYCIISEDKITLKLDSTFLPKVCTSFHRSQEIFLPSFCQDPSNEKEEHFHCLDVRRCVIQYLEATRSWRKTQAMLVLFSGVNRGKQASRASIARWIKQTITMAYQLQGKEVPQLIKAHSTRAVSTSWAERAGVSVEQICRAATWSNKNTFVKHYRLNFDSSRDLIFGRRVLQAAVPP
ncbi:uncharacterized protein [Hyperolius riggenbachi]|uniref:uncharacterized protein n=1 Tax=Hyperolius riggenbachi TaxID=752182 RepID=UPI0035A3C3F8